MPRGIKVRQDKIATVKQSLRRNGFARQQDLVEKIGIGKNTISKFFTGKVIDYLNLSEICNALNLQINDIADFTDGEIEETPETPKPEIITPPQQPQPSQKTKVVLQQAIPAVPVWKGRDELLTELQQKLLNPEKAPKVLALIGQGGIGKTSLAVKFLAALGINITNQNLAENCPYECVMYFKTQEGTSFDDVAEFLLIEGLGIQLFENLKTADEKIAKIIQGFLQTRCLLVLDNLESILQPANHDQAGKTISPDWGKLLNALVYQQHQSQTILTSREVPADLADTRYAGAEPDSELVNIIPVTGVSIAAGVEILQQRQLQDSLADLQWVSERVDGHVFLLTQLAAIGKGKPGYLRKHPELVTKKAEPILKEQLARQTEAAQDLLRRMCVLRVGIDIRGLTFLRLSMVDDEKFDQLISVIKSGNSVEFSIEKNNETEVIVEQLVNCSLLQIHYDKKQYNNIYELHEVIKEYLLITCRDEDIELQLIFSAYLFYLSEQGDLEKAKSLEDISLLMEAQYFAFLAQKYIVKDMEIEEKLETETSIACSLRILGLIEINRGNWNEAKWLHTESLRLFEKLSDLSGIAFCCEGLGEIEFQQENWKEAKRFYRKSLELKKELDQEISISIYWDLGYIDRKHGNWNEAKLLYEEALDLNQKLGDSAGIATAIMLLGKTELGQNNIKVAARYFKKACKQFKKLDMTWHIAMTNYDLGKVERKRSNLELAQQHYQTAYQLFQQVGATEDLEEIEKEWNIN